MQKEEAGAFSVYFPVLDLGFSGSSANKAWQLLAEGISNETRSLLRELTHRLSHEGRSRKGLLLGLIDVMGSTISPEGPDYIWIFGALEEKSGHVSFCRASSESGRSENSFSVKESVLALAEHSLGRLRFARVSSDSRGDPVGPVVELQPPIATDLEAVWAEWLRLCG